MLHNFNVVTAISLLPVVSTKFKILIFNLRVASEREEGEAYRIPSLIGKCWILIRKEGAVDNKIRRCLEKEMALGDLAAAFQ